MKAIHPFPARMAPETIQGLIQRLPTGATVLDPMCGSGVVIRQAAERGLHGIGFDVDPLAVLMSRVWTANNKVAEKATEAAAKLHRDAAALRLADVRLPWIDRCSETKEFIAYWFAHPQRKQLRKLSFLLTYESDDIDPHVRDVLWLAMSRIIITKHVGASLAWDTPHSRPHKVRDENDFDVPSAFLRSVDWLSEALATKKVSLPAKVSAGDCRNLSTVRSGSVSAVITSPPYLNAIDYLRGHKFSLVWMGHTIPELREIRSGAIGTEAARNAGLLDDSALQAVSGAADLPPRLRNILLRYAHDAALFLQEMRRVLEDRGKLCLVLGDSNLRGSHVANSKLFAHLAREAGFRKSGERRRPLQENRRYLPTTSKNNTLENRMRYEVIQTYVATT
jgi:DNA modification methylase